MIECRPEPLTDAVLAEIARALDAPGKRRKTDTSDGLVSAEAAARGGVFFRVYANGRAVGWYVLGYQRHEAAYEAEIKLAHGAADFDLVANVMPMIEQQCGQCAAIRIETRRRGLVKKLERAGFGVASVTLRKQVMQ